MSHSPTSKSQLYYEGANGHGAGGDHRSRSRTRYENGTHDYRSNGRAQRSTGNIAAAASAVNENGHYDRYERDRSNERGGAYSRSSYGERAYSLPRQQAQQQQHANMQPSGYYTQERRGHRPTTTAAHAAREERNGRHYRDGSRTREDPRMSSSGGADTPDFYFMPSQRKYSGEVVRVYVDYNKDPNNWGAIEWASWTILPELFQRYMYEFRYLCAEQQLIGLSIVKKIQSVRQSLRLWSNSCTIECAQSNTQSTATTNNLVNSKTMQITLSAAFIDTCTCSVYIVIDEVGA